MNGPVVVFALIAVATNIKDVSELPGVQTVGYYATAGECQKDLLRLLNTANRSFVHLDCKPLKVSE